MAAPNIAVAAVMKRACEQLGEQRMRDVSAHAVDDCWNNVILAKVIEVRFTWIVCNFTFSLYTIFNYLRKLADSYRTKT